MELKGIDAKLFTMEPGSPIDAKMPLKDAKRRFNKYPGDFASGVVAVYDDMTYREHQLKAGKISVASFPVTTYGMFEGELCSSFLHLLKCYKKEKSLDKMPWVYPEVRDKLRARAQTVEDNRVGKCLVRVLKNLAIAAISAGVFLLLFWLLPKLEPASGLEFFLGLATVVAAGSCLAFSFWSVIGLLGLGPSEDQRRDLADAYIDAMRYIRFRILWFQRSYGPRAVPPYLAEAEKELLNQVENVKDVLRRELGEDWLVPMETVCEDDVDELEALLERVLIMFWLLNKEKEKILKERSNSIIESFDMKP